MSRALTLALALALWALVLLPNPPRQPLVTCGGCGTVNEPDRRICRSCGASL